MKALLQRAGQVAGCLLVGSMLVHAQGDQRPVTIRLEGAPANVKVAFLGANAEKTFATPSGAHEFALASDLLDPNKKVEIWEVVCDDGTVVFVMAPNAQLPPGCKGRRRLGVMVWRAGARFGANGSWVTSTPGLLTLSSAAVGGTFGAMKAFGKDDAVAGKKEIVAGKDEIIRPPQRTTFLGTFTNQLNLVPGGACNASWRTVANVQVVVTENEVIVIHVLPNGEVKFHHSPINREENRITGTGTAQVANTTYSSQMEIGMVGSGNSQKPTRVSQQITYRNSSNQQQCGVGYIAD